MYTASHFFATFERMKRHSLPILFATLCMAASAQTPTGDSSHKIDYRAEVITTASTGDFAPLYISALNNGTLSQPGNALIALSFSHDMDSTARFSYSYGARAYAGVSSSSRYMRYDKPTAQWTTHSEHPANLWLQEIYATVKYRSLFLSAGMQNTSSRLLNNDLTSGDLVESGNSRPMPGVRAGFIGFQDIPFTNGWVQIDGELFYGKYTDSDWWTSRFNRYTGHISTGQYAVYRRCYFRTNPAKPFSVTVGAQCASQFGGTTVYYHDGTQYKTTKQNSAFKDFIKMFFPTNDGSEEFVQGNTLGSWDLLARYRLRDGSQVKAYFQWPWEDGSGLAKRNGIDGLWGVEYDFPADKRLIRQVVVEYLSLTNQSGPIHWAPGDNPGADIPYQATGADDYYNNVTYNPYATYGMAIGSPMVMSPIYNLDGYMQFLGTRAKAIHLALSGIVGTGIGYRIKFGYRRAWGNGYVQLPEPIKATSVMVEGTYRLHTVDGLRIKAAIAYDGGTMPSNSFGALLTLSYNGSINL